MSAIDEYLANNARYAEGFSGPLPMPPSAHLAVTVLRLENGLIAEEIGLDDGVTALEQLGLIRPA